jgi:alpha-tubulin suppressor-like RCC1 family protein
LSSNGSAVISAFTNCETDSTGTLSLSSVASGVTQTITVNVTTAGTYNISATANGITFSGAGSLSTGTQTIILTASGTPQAEGRFVYTLNTAPNCSFDRKIGTGSSGYSQSFSWQTDLRFKQYANVQFNGSNFLASGGVTKDGQVFFWGRDYFGSIQNYGGGTAATSEKGSPVFVSGAGKWESNAVKVQLANDAYYILDASGNVWSFGSQEYGQLGDGVNGANVTVRKNIAGQVIKPSGVTRFLDMEMKHRSVVLLGDNGKVYYYGRNESTGVGAVTAGQMPFPSGVTAYTKIWQANENSYSLYMLGNDGNLYFTGTNNKLTGNASIASGTSTNAWGTNIIKVNLPAGEANKLVKVDAGNQTAFALTNEGKIYAWGKVRFDYGASAGSSYGTIYECMLNDDANITIEYNQYSHRTYYAYEPKIIKLPAGETSFIDVTAAATTNEFLCASGKAYVLGHETYVNEAGAFGVPSDSFVSYTNYQIIYALEPVANLRKINSAGYSTLAMDSDGKLWGFGDNRWCMTGAGFRCPETISTAVPLMNGNLDPRNPRPQPIN